MRFVKVGFLLIELRFYIPLDTKWLILVTLFLASILAYTTTTTTVLRPFVWDYPGEPVPEETLTHHHPVLIVIQYLSASFICRDP